MHARRSLGEADASVDRFARSLAATGVSLDFDVLYRSLLLQALRGREADVAWLVWSDDRAPVVVGPDTMAGLSPELASEFPESPREPYVLSDIPADDQWTRWCKTRGILSCAVLSLVDEAEVIGNTGIVSMNPDSLGPDELGQLTVVAGLAAATRRLERRLARLSRQFAEAGRAIDLARPAQGMGLSASRVRTLTVRLGNSLDVTYCRVGVCTRRADGQSSVTIRASGGPRPLAPVEESQPLGVLQRCAVTIPDHPAIFECERPGDATAIAERRWLFTPTTRTGIVLPFAIGPKRRGLLILGEERGSRSLPFGPERIAMLQAVANRLGEALHVERSVKREQRIVRKRQMDRAARAERRRLARELHDEVGQALSGLLVWVRMAKTSGSAGREDLEIFEEAAQNALHAARGVVEGLRNEMRVDPLEDAHRFADAALRPTGCKLSWIDARRDSRLEPKTARVIGRVIKESVTNILQHAAADAAEIRLENIGGGIRVTVQDNGVGFLLAQVTRTRDRGGLGLGVNHERAAQIGGSFEVHSSPGKGTTAVFEVPSRERLVAAQARPIPR